MIKKKGNLIKKIYSGGGGGGGGCCRYGHCRYVSTMYIHLHDLR